MFFTLARRYLPQSMRELASVECLWTRVRVCLQNFYVLATSSLALSNLLHFPDPLRPYCAEKATAAQPVSSFSPCPRQDFPRQLLWKKIPQEIRNGSGLDRGGKGKGRELATFQFRGIASRNDVGKKEKKNVSSTRFETRTKSKSKSNPRRRSIA